MNLTRAVESLKISTLMGYVLSKELMLELNKYRGAVSWKLTHDIKNDIRNLVTKELKVR